MFKIGERLAMIQARTTWLSRALSSSFSSGGQAPSNVLYKSTHSERRRPPLSIDYVLPIGRSAANPPHAAAAVERWNNERTDGRPTVA